ncbi:MAG: hypothetical protein OXN17_00060 [Candidatus Poribacteria bacterium]|nr:hypothetical protein [Candidatus Poribacteria bacterium]
MITELYSETAFNPKKVSRQKRLSVLAFFEKGQLDPFQNHSPANAVEFERRVRVHSDSLHVIQFIFGNFGQFIDGESCCRVLVSFQVSLAHVLISEADSGCYTRKIYLKHCHGPTGDVHRINRDFSGDFVCSSDDCFQRRFRLEVKYVSVVTDGKVDLRRTWITRIGCTWITRITRAWITWVPRIRRARVTWITRIGSFLARARIAWILMVVS